MSMMSISMICKDEYENDLGAGAVIRLCTPGTLMLPLYKVKKTRLEKNIVLLICSRRVAVWICNRSIFFISSAGCWNHCPTDRCYNAAQHSLSPAIIITIIIFILIIIINNKCSLIDVCNTTKLNIQFLQPAALPFPHCRLIIICSHQHHHHIK